MENKKSVNVKGSRRESGTSIQFNSIGSSGCEGRAEETLIKRCSSMDSCLEVSGTQLGLADKRIRRTK